MLLMLKRSSMCALHTHVITLCDMCAVTPTVHARLLYPSFDVIISESILVKVQQPF